MQDVLCFLRTLYFPLFLRWTGPERGDSFCQIQFCSTIPPLFFVKGPAFLCRKDWKFFLARLDFPHVLGKKTDFCRNFYYISLFFFREIRRLRTSKFVTHATGLFSLFPSQLHTLGVPPPFEGEEKGINWRKFHPGKGELCSGNREEEEEDGPIPKHDFPSIACAAAAAAACKQPPFDQMLLGVGKGREGA